METDLQVTKNYVKENTNRLSRHKNEFDKRMDKVADNLKKLEKILFEDGLVSCVKVNAEYIRNHMNKGTDILNYVYKAILAVTIGYIAMKIGMK